MIPEADTCITAKALNELDKQHEQVVQLYKNAEYQEMEPLAR